MCLRVEAPLWNLILSGAIKILQIESLGKIAGKPSSSTIRHLKVNNVEISDFPDIAQTFSNNSSPENYSNKFQSFRRQAENQQLKFKSSNYENYNNPFSLDELTDAIFKSDTAVGPDDVHYQMLKHHPNDALLTLLNILNNIWASGKFPTSWCNSTVIPIPNYSVMERMINSRLVWYLERNKLISPMQCGFRKQRSTTDNLVWLESFVREAFAQRQHAVGVFFDLEKAYVEVWYHERSP